MPTTNGGFENVYAIGANWEGAKVPSSVVVLER